MGKEPESQLDEGTRKKVHFISSWAARSVAFFSGIIWVGDEYPQIDYKEYLGDNYDKGSNITSGIYVSNHLSWLDILIGMFKISPPGFISRANVKNYPCVGYVARCLGCIFVQRDDKSNKSNVIDQVKQKHIAVHNKQDQSNFLIFAEGTTSNGSHLLSFKKGAFITELPVTPLVIMVNKEDLSLCMDVIEMLYHILIVICNPYFTIKILHLPIFIPNEYLFTSSKFSNKKERWEIYAESVRDAMSKASGLNKSELSYEDKVKYLEFLRKTKKME